MISQVNTYSVRPYSASQSPIRSKKQNNPNQNLAFGHNLTSSWYLGGAIGISGILLLLAIAKMNGQKSNNTPTQPKTVSQKPDTNSFPVISSTPIGNGREIVELKISPKSSKSLVAYLKQLPIDSSAVKKLATDTLKKVP